MTVYFRIFLKNPRLVIFPALISLLIIFSMRFGFLKTWNCISDCKNLKQKIEKFEQAESDPNILKQKLTDLEHRLGFSDLPETEIRQNILDRLGVEGKYIPFMITRIPPPCVYQKEDYEVIINTVCIEGSFDHLLRLLNNMELDKEVPKIISSSFRLNKDRITHETSLSLSMYFQTVRKINP